MLGITTATAKFLTCLAARRIAAVIGSLNKALFALLIILLGLAPAQAQSSTNPVAPIPQLQLQNEFDPGTYKADGYSNVFYFQPVIPYKLGGLNIISRITLPLVTTADPDPISSPVGTIDFDRVTGLSDLTTINFAMGEIKSGFWAGDIGFGPALIFPTSTDDQVGSSQWQAGPNFIYINTAGAKIEWGVLLYQQWSIGNKDNGRVSQMLGQPIFTYHLNNGWYLSTGDHIWSYDWENEVWDIPVSFGVGKEFKIGNQSNNVYVIPFYNVGDAAAGNTEWGIKLSWALLFPH
jgi:hypothetical protein